MTERVYNFSPGPAVLPLPVLEQVSREMICLPGAGCSILELGHRTSTFREILSQTQHDLRRLLQIPDNYQILFLQGGSRLQFSMVPLNLLSGASCPAEYIVTGSWGSKALVEARRMGPAEAVWEGGDTNYDRLPPSDSPTGNPAAPYVYFTSNETIQGVQFAREPNAGNVPLVCDASSDFLSRPLDLQQYGMIFACAQKNAGPAGVTVVIIRNDLLQRDTDQLPGYLSYRNHAQEDSLYNTPTTFGVYVVGLVSRWLLEDIGGLNKMDAINRQKAKMLYDVLDQFPDFYRGHAMPECRSQMNVTFRLPSNELQEDFLREAEQRQLHNLKGHRSVGGVRASIYNAMPAEGVTELRDCMLEFAAQHGHSI